MSTETGQLPVQDDESYKRFNEGDRITACDTNETVARMETKLNQLHEVVFTMLKGMEDARNSPGMMGMMAKNMLPEIPDLSQYTSNGVQGD